MNSILKTRIIGERRIVMIAIAVLLLLSMSMVGCGGGGDDGDSNPTGPGGGTGNGNGTLTALVDGVQYTAISVVAINNSGAMGIGSSDAGTFAGFGLGWIDGGVGTFTMGAASGATGTLVDSSGGTSWQAGGALGSGSIVVTTRTATRVAGTFSFVAMRIVGSGGSELRVVTNGAFDVNF